MQNGSIFQQRGRQRLDQWGGWAGPGAAPERALPYSSGAAGQVRGRGRAGRGEGTEQKVATSFFRICVPEPVVTSLPLVRSLSWGRGEFKCVYREVTMR